jgi:AcrR family transcriptional regulator
MTPFSPGQDSGTSGPAQGPAPAGLIWTRPPEEKRERPTREAIVAAATDLADTHGLDAVSIRRVAAALQTRPMDLYRYFARKDELIDLMVDEAVAGAVLDELPRDWRDALAAIARALHAVCLAHPWMVTAAGRQALIGPNVIRHVEQSLEATAALGTDWTKRLAIWRDVDSYTMGHAHLSPARDQREGTTANDPPEVVTELIERFEALAQVNEESRSSVFAALESGDEPDYVTAYQALFAAVAVLSPAQAPRVLDARLGPKS